MPEFHEVIDRPVIYPMKPETRTLLAMLCNLQIGETATYESMGGAIGRDVHPACEAHHLLVTARRRAMMDHRRVFRAVPTVGLQRLDDVGKVEESTRQIVKSRRCSGRAVRMATSVDDYSALPRDRQIEHNRNLSIAGVLRQFTSITGQQKIGNLVANAQASVPVLKALEAFKDS